jgi:hypothetical protein
MNTIKMKADDNHLQKQEYLTKCFKTEFLSFDEDNKEISTKQ